MNTKKSLLAIAAIALFALSSCTSTNSSDDDKLYERSSIDRTEIPIPDEKNKN
ncbi:peptidase m28 [Cellulophaga baltica 4]|nr:peptidase m28 [Cellulophaga baltica 4]